jgi:hypothetical protein
MKKLSQSGFGGGFGGHGGKTFQFLPTILCGDV